jgi:hypothetical protein
MDKLISPSFRGVGTMLYSKERLSHGGNADHPEINRFEWGCEGYHA